MSSQEQISGGAFHRSRFSLVVGEFRYLKDFRKIWDFTLEITAKLGNPFPKKDNRGAKPAGLWCDVLFINFKNQLYTVEVRTNFGLIQTPVFFVSFK